MVHAENMHYFSFANTISVVFSTTGFTRNLSGHIMYQWQLNIRAFMCTCIRTRAHMHYSFHLCEVYWYPKDTSPGSAPVYQGSDTD